MSNINNKTRNELKIRRETLDKHLAKFNQFKNGNKWSEAWDQLLITLNYANDILKYSTNLLKNISQKMPNLNQKTRNKVAVLVEKSKSQKKSTKKMIVIPKHQNIH